MLHHPGNEIPQFLSQVCNRSKFELRGGDGCGPGQGGYSQNIQTRQGGVLSDEASSRNLFHDLPSGLKAHSCLGPAGRTLKVSGKGDRIYSGLLPRIRIPMRSLAERFLPPRAIICSTYGMVTPCRRMLISWSAVSRSNPSAFSLSINSGEAP